ncbi:MAG: hypothetical protein IPN21_17495 [Burkholderiales bacterium]|nr:hypothetical protein [Burkholderiales bacterium]
MDFTPQPDPKIALTKATVRAGRHAGCQIVAPPRIWMLVIQPRTDETANIDVIAV